MKGRPTPTKNNRSDQFSQREALHKFPSDAPNLYDKGKTVFAYQAVTLAIIIKDIVPIIWLNVN